MAYRIDGQDIVIDGWENGIADSPYQGINDMRGVNIISIPQEVSVSFAPTVISLPHFGGQITSVDTGADTITIASPTGTIANGQAVTFDGTPPAPLVVGTTYWIYGKSGNTFKLKADPFDIGAFIDLTSYTGPSGALTTDIGEIKYFDKVTGACVDGNGRAWGLSNGSYRYLGNPVTGTSGLAGTNGNGIIFFRNYLFVFYNASICYLPYNASGSPVTYGWVNEWDPVTGAAHAGTYPFNSSVGTSNPHDSLISKNKQGIYITDANYLCALLPVIDNTTGKYKVFNPADTTTYTWTNTALILPLEETATCLEELGNYLLVGGIYNVIYPWDKTSSGYNTVVKLAENYTSHMITVNTNTYIFCGVRGRIFVYNGSQANLWKKVPDFPLGIDPIFTWNNSCYNKNQLYFGVSVQTNGQVSSQTYAGLWAVDLTTTALRCVSLQTTTTADVCAVYANAGVASGYGLTVAWKNAGTTYGIDSYNSATPYTSYTSYIETDFIPIGNFLNKKTYDNLEFKLAAPLVSGEGIKISARADKAASYVQIGETTTVGAVSDAYTPNFDQTQWIQLKVEMKSTASNPSYVRLKELRLRSLTQ